MGRKIYLGIIYSITALCMIFGACFHVFNFVENSIFNDFFGKVSGNGTQVQKEEALSSLMTERPISEPSLKVNSAETDASALPQTLILYLSAPMTKMAKTRNLLFIKNGNKKGQSKIALSFFFF